MQGKISPYCLEFFSDTPSIPIGIGKNWLGQLKMKCFIHLFFQLIFESLLYARHLKLASAYAWLSSTFSCMDLWYCLGTRWGPGSRVIREDLEAWATRGLITSWFNTSKFGAIIDTNHTLIKAAYSRGFQCQPKTLHTWMPLFTTLTES